MLWRLRSQRVIIIIIIISLTNMLTDFQFFFTVVFSMKFATKSMSYI